MKILDFGFAKFVKNDENFMDIEYSCGTPNYVGNFIIIIIFLNYKFLLIAPEILRGEKATFPSDIFSLGVILYYMLSGALPFDD